MPKYRPLYSFLTRWLVCSLGLWIAAGFLGSGIDYGNKLINAIVKPVLIILSLPAILLSLGLFMIIINGLTVYIASKLYEPLHVTNFWAAIFAGIIIGLVNYLVSAILEDIQR
jgi:putative membrane protein